MPVDQSKSLEALAHITLAQRQALRETTAITLPSSSDELADKDLGHDKATVIRNLRALGEHMEDVVRDYVVEKFISQEIHLEDSIHAIHIAATAGWIPYEGEDPETQVYEHTFRDSGVRFGDVIPVKYEDVEELFSSYMGTLQRLLENCTKQDFEYVMSWAYISFVSIHPYPDANGRTGRAIVRFISEYFVRRFGYEGIKSFPNYKEEELRAKAADFMNKAMFELGFFPKPKDAENGSSSEEIYYEFLIDGKVDQYFSELKQRMQAHFFSIQSSDQLRQFGYVKEATAYLDKVELLKPKETRPLIALETATRFKQLLEERDMSIDALLEREAQKGKPETDQEKYSASNIVVSCFFAEFNAALMHKRSRKIGEINILVDKYLSRYALLLREEDKRMIAEVIKEKGYK
ncbi:MAG: Fic family protein [Candidatus Pacebacteria bacterium]|nr:Fic family protein [Candidatus Paceibacterota bacterium]